MSIQLKKVKYFDFQARYLIIQDEKNYRINSVLKVRLNCKKLIGKLIQTKNLKSIIAGAVSMQHLMFKANVKTVQLEKYIQSLKQDQPFQKLTTQIKSAVAVLQSFIERGSHEEKCFFRNYETLISLIYEKEPDKALNLSLHWINLYGQRLIEVNKIQEAASVLECALNFIDNPKIDRLLLCTALNNLALIYKLRNDLKQSLNLLVTNIDLCIQSIKDIKNLDLTSEKQKIQLFTVILVNGFKNAKNIAVQLTIDASCEDEVSELIDMKNNFNKLGYETCITYLGKKSYFTQFFDPIKKPIPSIQKIQHIDTQTQQIPMISINENTFKSFESEMFSRLEMIESILKLKETVTNTEQFSEHKETEIQESIMPPEQAPQIKDVQPLPQQNFALDGIMVQIVSFFARNSKLDKVSFEINGWDVEIEFVKVFGKPLGKLEFKCKNSGEKINLTHTIVGANLLTIMNLTSLQDTMSYEHSLQDLPPNFITTCIKPYLSISKQGRLIFFPKSKGLAKQCHEAKFLGMKCYISINHIKGTTFRIGISPIEESGSVYLDVQFTEETLNEIMEELIDPIPSKIQQLYENTFLIKKKKNTQKNSSKIKSMVVKNFALLEFRLEQIVTNFEHFLSSEESFYSGGDLLSLIEKDQTYFRFLEVNPLDKGIYFRVNFLKNSKCFSVYAEQISCKVQNPTTKRKKVSGAAIFDQTQFQEVFGFPINEELLKLKIKKIEEVICQKYYLNLKRLPQDMIRDSYQFSQMENNLILEKSFTFHNFKVEFTTKQQQSQYFQVVTASIVTVSSIYPIGIKINLYNPEDTSSKGYFISLSPEDWRFENLFQDKGGIVKGKQLNEPLEKVKKMFRKYNEKYGCSQNYFLDFWMEKQGFKNLMSKIINPKSCLYLQKNLNSIINWNMLFQQ